MNSLSNLFVRLFLLSHLWIVFGVTPAVRAAEPGSPPGGVSSNLTSLVVIGARWSNAPLASLRQAAERGDTHAQFFLGWTYRRGIGVQSNDVEAARWYRKAAEKNLAEAQARLGWMHEYGLGVPEDPAEAKRWLEAAADQGWMPAIVNLGQISQNRRRNPAEAVEWYRMAAERGHANAQFWLAQLLTSGQIKRDEKEALKWLRKSAEQGNIGAAETLGGMLRHNSFETKADPVEAAKWVKIAAEAGRLRAQFDLAEMLDQGQAMPQNHAEALRWYQRVAEGDAERYSRVVDAWLRIGEMYLQGLGTSKDLNKAREWFLQCAEDRPQARVYLATMSEKGEGVPRDDKLAAEQHEAAFRSGGGVAALEPLLNMYVQKRARPSDPDTIRKLILRLGQERRTLANARVYYLAGELFRLGIVMNEDAGKAAEFFNKAVALGSPEAQVRIGQFWQAGTSGQVDAKEAVRWFRRAAIQGAAEAQFLLGRAYANGDGVEQEIVSALKWTMLAARQQWEGANALQQKLESGATPEQIESARQQADQFKAQAEPSSKGTGVRPSRP